MKAFRSTLPPIAEHGLDSRRGFGIQTCYSGTLTSLPLEAGLRRRQNRLVAKRSPSCSCEHETTFDDVASRCCRVRTEKSRLRLAGVRAAAELGRPLSAFAIGAWQRFRGARGLLGRRVWARDSRCGARRMGHAWRSRGSSPANFSPPFGVAKFPRLRGRRRSFGPPRSFHGLVAKASSAKKVAPARRPSRPGSARFSDGALTYTPR